MSLACGIDFGTSNSAVALSGQGSPRLLALQGGATSVPTALFFSFEDDTTTYGREAMRRYLEQERGRLLRSIKSLLGTRLFDELTQVKYRRYAFSEIIADFLRFLRNAAAAELGRAPDKVVIGRPAFFVDDDTAADSMAEAQLLASAHAAGFKTVAFQLEPIAAALHYERQVAAEEIALVADIGGGTSDFSIVRVSPKLAAKSDRRARHSRHQRRAYRRHRFRPPTEPGNADAVPRPSQQAEDEGHGRAVLVFRRPRDLAPGQRPL